MCGIFGYVGHLEKERGIACTRELAHRGPDSEGFYTTPEVFLGHRRLAIVDLSPRGAQPMSDRSGRYHLIYNGEIYNFIELKGELESLGHTFISDSDTEVILAAFMEWGEASVLKFNGMWALAIWDNFEKRLFLSRDRFGKKPLFYAHLGNDLAFGSEMKAVAPLLPALKPNMKIIRDIPRIFYYESTAECVIEGLRRFPAGHNGWFKNGRLELARYWHTLDHIIPVPETYEDQVAAFRELFLDACRIRMRSDVPIGTALSGGLDSSATFAAVSHLSRTQSESRINRDWQHAFSATFPGTPLDELEWARKVADHCGVKITPVVINPEEHLEEFYDHFYRFEDLYITPHIPFIATYRAMRQAGVIVTLDGHGADELFGGYSFDYLHRFHDVMFNPSAIKNVVDAHYGARLIAGTQFCTLPPRPIFIARHYAKNAVKKLLRVKNIHPDSQHPAWSRLDYFTQKLYISFHQTVLPTLLRNYDRYSMASGVEVRMPFLDHRIVSFAFSLPATSKIRNGYTKSIVRDAVADLMPKEVAYRKTKIGFNAPMVDWFQGPMRTLLQATLEEAEFKSSAIVDQELATRLVNHVITDPTADFLAAEAAWKALAPYYWEKGFFNKIKKI